MRHKLTLLGERLEAIPPDDAVADLKADREEARAAAQQAQVALPKCLLVSCAIVGGKTGTGHKQPQGQQCRRTFRIDLRTTRRGESMTHSRRTRGILESFSAALVRRNSDKISTLILDSLHQLLGKPKLVGGVHLDPDTFELCLSDASRRRPCHRIGCRPVNDSCSLLRSCWGLARLSGRATADCDRHSPWQTRLLSPHKPGDKATSHAPATRCCCSQQTRKSTRHTTR